MEQAKRQLAVHFDGNMPQCADAVLDGVGPFGPQYERVPRVFVLVERADFQQLLLHPEGSDVKETLVIAVEQGDLILPIGVCDCV